MSEPEYSDESFWDKLKEYAIVAGREVVETALKLFYCMKDEDTPLRAKVVIAGALLYFIMPVDAVPDFLPGGYVDDLGALSGALLTVAAHIKDEHAAKAKAKMAQWFGAKDSADEHKTEIKQLENQRDSDTD